MSSSQDNPSGYGFEYSSKDLPTYTPPSISALRGAGVRFIRLTWVDISNTTRFRIIPIQHFVRILASNRPAISMIAGAPIAVFNAPPSIEGISGERIYTPDLSSLRPATYAPGHATVFGWFESKGEQSGPIGICPRGLLKRTLSQAESESGVRYLVGFESEFILLKKTDDGSVQSVNSHHWSVSRALLSGSPEAACLEDIVKTLEECKIYVEMYHSEAAPGQYEIVTGPLPPLEAADALVVTREVILNVADRHGLRATFAPRVFPNDFASGCHAHISVHPASPSHAESELFTRPGSGPRHMTAAETHFLAGVLAHLPALCALTLPTTASYARMQDGISAGGTYVAWGCDTRETPVRLCGSPKTGAAHFEFRPLDGTANPHVALASVLGAGARAIAQRTPLGIAPCETQSQTPAEMGAAERAGLGIVDRLPLKLADARLRLSEDAVVMEILGEVGSLWNPVNEALEKALDDKAQEYNGDMARVMVELY